MKKYIFIGGAAFALFDQVGKWIILNYFPELVTYNSGVAFGIAIPQPVLLIGIPLILAFLIYYFLQYVSEYSLRFILYLALILGGGLGNYIDRLTTGRVVDFIDLGFWPSFNFADTFLVVGIIGLMLELQYGGKK